MRSGRRLHMMADSDDSIKRRKLLISHEYAEEFEDSHQDKVNFTLKRFVLRPRAWAEIVYGSGWLNVPLDSIPLLYQKHKQHLHFATRQTVNQAYRRPRLTSANLSQIYICLQHTVAVYVA